jgi:glucose-1-phosphate thymidylyltransferase
MLAGITDILVITRPIDRMTFQGLLGNGNSLGINLTYAVQENPEGLAQAFTIGDEFIGSDSVALILGDNIFHGGGLGQDLRKYSDPSGATIFGYPVADPQRYGVAEVSSDGQVISLEEKPALPKSNLAIPGIYFFDNSVILKAKNVKKSSRGELEIISVLGAYQKDFQLNLQVLTRGTVWLDCGTAESLNDASNYIRTIQDRQNLKIGCIEEVAWRNNWISKENLLKIALSYGANDYADYLRSLVD